MCVFVSKCMHFCWWGEKGGVVCDSSWALPNKTKRKSANRPEPEPASHCLCLSLMSSLLLCLLFACLHAHTEKTRVGNRHQNRQRKRETETSRRASTLLHRSNLFIGYFSVQLAPVSQHYITPLPPPIPLWAGSTSRVVIMYVYTHMW